MKACNKILMAAAMSMSIGTAAWAQQTAGGTAADGTTGHADVNTGTGAAGTGAAGAAGAAGGTGSTGADAMGAQANDTSRSMSGASAADAQLGAQLDKIASMPEKAGDALFILDNAKGNMFEVEFARLAQQKAQDSKIKELAKMIETDHSAANDQLKPIAQKMGLELPTSLPSEKQKMLAVFQAMDVKDFETCYLLDNKMVHAKDITSFADHQKSVKDEDLRKYIAAVLPKLTQHGMHVSQLASEKGFPTPMALGASAGGHGGMDHGAMGGAMGGAGGKKAGDLTSGGSGAHTDPTAPANNQNPSNR